MARLPSRFDLSGPANLRSGRPIASIDTSGIARGVGQLGASLENLGADLQKERNVTDITAADGPALKELHDFTRTFDEDGDYATFGKRAENGIAAIGKKYADRITDPKARQMWLDDFSKRGETARNSIADLGEKRVRESELAGAKSGLESYQQIIADDTVSADDRERAKVNANAAIDALASTGKLSPSEADTWRDTIIKGGEFVLGQREIEKDPSIISGKLPSKVADRAGMAMSFFQQKGWSKEQAAGIVGNLLAESSLNTGARNAGDGTDGSDSIGVAQWNSGRAKALQQYAREVGKDWRDFDTQLEFVNEELNSSEKGAGTALRNAKDVQQATEAMIMYERPAGSQKGARNAHNYNGRLKYAQQAAGETIRPDWYLSQSPDKQLQLQRQAEVQQNQNAAAAVARQKAEASQAVDDFQLRIATNDPTLTQAQIMNDGRIDNGQRATLIKSFNDEQQSNAGVNSLIEAISAGKNVPINGFNSDETKIAEKAYKRLINTLPADQQPRAANSFIQSTGFIPKGVEADLRAGASSTSPEDVSVAMRTAQTLSRIAPTGFASMTGVDGIRKQMDLYQTYTQSMGLTDAQAAEKVIASNDPEQIRRRDAILKSEPIKKLLKEKDASDVAAIFDKGIFSAAPDVGKGAGIDRVKVGVSPEAEAAIVADYRSVLEEALIDANGDQTAAEDIAQRRFQKVYGTTRFSPLSGNIVVRYPPEKAYPAMPDGTHDYVQDQLAEALKAEGISADRYYLQGDGDTEKDIQAGNPARYQVFYEKDGKIQRFNLPFYADPAIAKANYDQKQADISREAERRMLENRAEQQRVYPDGQGLGQRERFGNNEFYRGVARDNSPLGRAQRQATEQRNAAAAAGRAQRASDDAERAAWDALSPEEQRARSLDEFLNGGR